MHMNVHIRKGTSDDYPALLGLIKELAEFEKCPDGVTNSVEKMVAEQHLFDFFVAEVEDKVVGMAIFFYAYYTWVGKSLYLDDLYVQPDFRGQGIGTKLLIEVFRLAQTEGCGRLRWQVLDWNTEAIDFYKKCGADISSEWYNCDFDKEGIQTFLDQKLK